MMSLWDALRMNMMISYQELVRTFPKGCNEYSICTSIIYAVEKLTARFVFFLRVDSHCGRTK
ncbi:TPA: hypothetical protein MI589_20340 [Klebsiella pneumoniae]|nr:hypothetical protein [Klebsiella pneumoniae]